jgi:hypothetical protein
MEYFLASTQWFIPGKDNDLEKLIWTVESIIEKQSKKPSAETSKVAEKTVKKAKKSGKFTGGIVAISVLICVLAAGLLFFSSKKTDDYPKHKAIVERCCRKARMYYGNNKTIQFLIEDTNIEIAKIEKNLQSIKRKNTLIVMAVVILYLLLSALVV